jgi:hypothetical protein
MMKRYDWVTTEMFDTKLAELLDDLSGYELLAIPGLYEVVSEQLNNDVLEALEAEREENEQGESA